MADKTFNDVKINLTLKPQTTRANVSSSQEDLAVQMGKIQKWFADMDSHIPFNSHYGICDTAAATVAKTVSCTGFTLTTGALIVVKFTVTNTGAVASLTLNVNNTGAKSIKYRGGNVSSAGNLAANRIYAFVYDGTNWELIGDFDTNSNNYDRTSVQTRIYAGTKGVFPYSLCAMDTAQRMQAFTTTGGTATTKVFNSSEKFAYPPVIMYHSQNATIANGSVIANNVLYEQYPSIDMRYNANVTSSAAYTQYKPLYVECTVDSDGYWSPTGITQTFTSGKYYILLGCTYSTSIYQMALFAQHPMYYYNGTKLIDADIQRSDSKYALTTHTHDVFSTSADGFVPKASTSGDTDKFLKGDGTWATPPSGTDTKVTQNNTTSNSSYRLLLSASANDTTETNTSNKSTKFQANPSTGTLTATNFAGKINNHTVNADVPDGAVFTDTTYTAGTGLALNGTTFNHANSAITAQTTQALYPIKYDTQGHITGAGSAVTTLKNPTALTVKYNTTQSFTYDGSAAKTLSIKAGSNVTVTGDTSGNITIAAADTNTDTKVTQAYSTTNNTYPVLLSSVAGISSTASRGDQTSIVNNQIYANPYNGRLYANIPEAFLFWGGKDISGSYGPIDAAMIPTLSANRAAFYPGDRIVVEYTRDGGTTWLDYGADNATKTALFTTNASFLAGKSTTSEIATASCKLRITIKNTSGKLYSVIQKIAMYVSTNGSTGCTVAIKGRTRTNVEAESDTWADLKTDTPISGWSGWNILQTSFTTYGNTKSQYDEIQFIFSITGQTSPYAGLNVQKIYMYGGVGWTTPSTMASTGSIYSYDVSQNVVFPAKVTATSIATSSGDITCGGTFVAKANVYTDSLSAGALNMRNSDIYGCNSIKFADLCDNGAEGIQFYRDGTHADSFYSKSGKLYYHPNRAYGSTAGDVYTILHTGNLTITQSLTSGTKIGTITIDGTGTDLYAPSNTDTKVTQAYSTTNNSYPLLFSATAGISSTASRGAQTSILNNQIYANPSTGAITATAFTGNMTPKVLTSSTLASTEGNFFFSGSGLLENPSAYDWVGIQAGDADDKWQLTLHDGHVYVRQNDSGGTSSTNWTPWRGLIDPFLVTAEDGLTVTKTQTTFGSGDTALAIDTGVKIGLGSAITIQGLTVNTTVFGTANPKIVFNNADGSQAIELQMNDYDSIAAPASLTLVGNQGNEYLIAPQFAARTEMGTNLTACQNTTLTKYGLYFRSYRAGTSQNYAAYGIRTYDGKANANNGMLLTVGGGGLTVIGSGEAPENIANLIADDQSTASPTKFYPVESETDVGPYNGSDEELIIASDQNIFLLTYCNNMENRGGWRVSWEHHLLPLQTAHSTIGNTTYYVKNIYTNELVAATSTTSRSTNIRYNLGVVCKPSNATTGGWTMGLIFENFADTQLLQFGAMGAGQALEFGFIGPTYNDNWMRFYPTEIRTYKNPITRNATVSAWSYVKARDNGIVYSNFDQDMSLDRFYPAFFAKSHTGGWAVGSNGSNDRLYFSFSTDTVYAAGSGSVSNFYVESNGVTNIRPAVINSTLVTPSSETNYTVPIHTGTLSTGDKYMYNTSGFTLSTLEGTTSAAGISRLKLGNNTASGTAGNKTGAVQLFSTTAYYTELRPISGVSGNRTVYFPNETGYALLSTQSAPQALLYSGSSNNPGTETITISNLFTNYKVIYVVVQKAAYGHNQEASEWYGYNFIVPLQFVKSKSTTATIGTTANPGYFVQIGYHPHLGQTYRILVQYVDASNIKISIVNDATTPVIQMTNTLGTIKIYGIY